jgi:hypothetical protein
VPGSIKTIPMLSAVSTNVKVGTEKSIARFWYMLPSFVERHNPDVFIPRVNSESIRAYYNTGRKCIVDANFSTIWVDNKNTYTKYFLVAFLNTRWVSLYLEDAASKMGGGALKVEASHIRQIPLPVLTKEQISELHDLGKKLTYSSNSESSSILEEVERLFSFFLKIPNDKYDLDLRLAELIKIRK